MGTVLTSVIGTSPAATDRPEAGRVCSGLSPREAQRRLTEFGPNEIRKDEATNALVLFAHQFASPVIWLLLAASLLSAALGEILDATAIAIIVIINGVIGFVQEHRAERAVMALRSMTAPRARVMRDGRSVVVRRRPSFPVTFSCSSPATSPRRTHES
jgi:Ca2+-transporting ATPase